MLQCDTCAEHNELSDRSKVGFLRVALDKTALQLLWDYGSTAESTYELKARLRKRYGHEGQAET
jgi:hypothetical protein